MVPGCRRSFPPVRCLLELALHEEYRFFERIQRRIGQRSSGTPADTAGIGREFGITNFSPSATGKGPGPSETCLLRKAAYRVSCLWMKDDRPRSLLYQI